VQDNVTSGFSEFGTYLRRNWLALACLAVTATRTWDIVAATSPAIWLPPAGVLIMEGSWFFWNGRTEEAGRTAQRVLAIIATVITWLTIFATVAADAAWQASKRGLFGFSEMPAWADTVAVFSVIVVAMLHIGLFVFYKYIDPVTSLKREHAAQARDIQFQGLQAQLNMTREEMNNELEGWRGVQGQAGKLFGTLAFRKRFHNRFGMYPEDLDKQDLKEMTRLLDKPTKQPTIPEITITKLDELPSKNGNPPAEVGGGVDHRNFTQPGDRRTP
jgi:hypothetical protein